METLRSEDEIRRYAVRQLRATGFDIRDVPEPMWEDRWRPNAGAILESGDDQREDHIEDLVMDLERDLSLFAACEGWGLTSLSHHKSEGAIANASRPAPTDALPPDPYEDARGRALTAGLAAIAADRPEVRGFREEALGGGPRSPAAVRAFLASPLAQMLLRHTVRSLPLALAPVDIPSRVEPTPPEDEDEREGIVVVVEPLDKRITCRWPRGTPLVTLPLPPECSEPVFYRPGSLLAELHKVAKRLSGQIPPWDEAGAAWFVLTGEAPAVLPLYGVTEYRRASLGIWERAVITLHAEPWVSAERVADLYRLAQQRVFPERARRRTPALLYWEFDQNERRKDGAGLTLEETRRRWNAAHPEAPAPDRSGWHKALARGAEHAAHILHPGYLAPSARRRTDPATPISTPIPADFGDTPRTY